jgi:redox-sensitive bicupin YhaK (pirin superfamily)
VTDDRGRSSAPGIESWHSFSAGPFYDPARMSFGPVIGVDEHHVAPGAGFDWHAHRGVHIASWVLSGALRHEDATGTTRLVRPGPLFVQSTGAGIRHREWNASETEELRFVQITILARADTGGDSAGDAARTWFVPLPAEVAGVRIEVAEAIPDGAFGLRIGAAHLVLTPLD